MPWESTGARCIGCLRNTRSVSRPDEIRDTLGNVRQSSPTQTGESLAQVPQDGSESSFGSS